MSGETAGFVDVMLGVSERPGGGGLGGGGGPYKPRPPARSRGLQSTRLTLLMEIVTAVFTVQCQLKATRMQVFKSCFGKRVRRRGLGCGLLIYL